MGMKRELTTAEVGYLAGLVDGEGCISILRMQMKRGKRTYLHFALQIRIANTQIRLVEWIRDRVGGKLYAQTYVTRIRGNRKQAWHWHLGGYEASAFLRLVRPYLVIKGDQVDLALEFLGLGRGFAPAVRAEMRDRMRELNLKGIGYSTASGPASV